MVDNACTSDSFSGSGRSLYQAKGTFEGLLGGLYLVVIEFRQIGGGVCFRQIDVNNWGVVIEPQDSEVQVRGDGIGVGPKLLKSVVHSFVRG